ncbi:unnamed protein product, partial [Ectocarpus sp. 8 AP-2014]
RRCRRYLPRPDRTREGSFPEREKRESWTTRPCVIAPLGLVLEQGQGSREGGNHLSTSRTSKLRGIDLLPCRPTVALLRWGNLPGTWE